MELHEYERLIPNVQAEGLTWITPNQQTAWRIETLLTKEPDTIQWIRSMEPGETLFDIGANIGQYALLAAKKGVTVHAFEPEAQNFALLIRNIAINKLQNITAWPVALSDHLSMEVLHLSSLFPGGSCHSYGDSVNYKGEEKPFPFQQGSISTTLDHFIARYGVPTHIKIDVDGFEHKVIKGISDVVLGRIRSVLVEINTHYPEHVNYILPRFRDLGFTYDEEQIQAARRKEGPFEGVGNYIFWKE